MGTLVAVGLILATQTSSGSVWRQLGLAVVGGGIVGGVLTMVEAMMTAASEQRAARQSLLQQLSSTITLDGIDLSNEDLQDIYLPGRSFVAAQLDDCNLDRAILLFGNFAQASMREISLTKADLRGSKLAGADLTSADLRSARLEDVDLSGAILDGAHLQGATLVGVRLDGASLRGVDLTGAEVRQTHLSGADFTGAKVHSCRFEGNEYQEAPTWTAESPIPPSSHVVQEAINQFDLPGYLAWRRRQDDDS